MAKFTATITKIKSAETKGVYKRTAIDDRKDAADFRIVAAGVVVANHGATLSGRGIRAINATTFSVTDAALDKIRQQFTVECDY